MRQAPVLAAHSPRRTQGDPPGRRDPLRRIPSTGPPNRGFIGTNTVGWCGPQDFLLFSSLSLEDARVQIARSGASSRLGRAARQVLAGSAESSFVCCARSRTGGPSDLEHGFCARDSRPLYTAQVRRTVDFGEPFLETAPLGPRGRPDDQVQFERTKSRSRRFSFGVWCRKRALGGHGQSARRWPRCTPSAHSRIGITPSRGSWRVCPTA